MFKKHILLLLQFLPFAIVNAQSTSAKGASVTAPKPDYNEGGRTFAIIIGVSNYTLLPDLDYADKDAVFFYNYLHQNTKPADKKNISLFLNKEVQRDHITEKLYEITDSVKRGDRVYIYFGGHGDLEHITEEDNCLLLLSDAPEKNYLRKSATYLDINLFRDFFAFWSKKEVKTFFICDACHSGKLSGGEYGRKNTILSLQQSWKNEARILSCQPDELSLEGTQWGGGRGLFSYYFVAALQGLADKNKDSLITLFEMQNYLRDSVSIHSEQSQIPVITGDVKTVVGKYNQLMFREAKASLNRRTTQAGNMQQLLAFKGNEEPDIERTIVDSTDRKLFRQFLLAIKNEILTGENNNSAYSIYKAFPEKESLRIAKGYMKLKLLAALQSGFEQLEEYLYDDKYDKFDFTKRYQLEKQIKVALLVTGESHHLYNRLKARELFLFTCNSLPEIQPGVFINQQIREKILTGIDLLNKALTFDPMAPFLYIRMGDFYLYTGSFTEAISAYTTYTKLLPKDEYAYNKLGMAYYLSGNAASAQQMFKIALSLNPMFYKAQENLRVAMQKR